MSNNSQTHTHTIYLVRHGESKGNMGQINLPPDEDILTENGRFQADLLGKHLKDIVFTKAYASNYARANDTANFVLTNSNMQKSGLNIDKRLRERVMGDLVGQPKKGFAAHVIGSSQGTLQEIPGAETWAEFDTRIESFLEDIFKKLQQSTHPETVLVVSHGLTILRLLTKFNQPSHIYSVQSISEDASRPMKNTSYHIFTVQVPSVEKIHLEFLHYHQRRHLHHLEEAIDLSKSKPADPVTLAINEIAEKGLDPSQFLSNN